MAVWESARARIPVRERPRIPRAAASAAMPASVGFTAEREKPRTWADDSPGTIASAALTVDAV